MRQQGKYQEAEEAYKDVISRRSGYWLAMRDLGDLYYRSRTVCTSCQQFQSVIDLAPDNPLGYYRLGRGLFGIGTI